VGDGWWHAPGKSPKNSAATMLQIEKCKKRQQQVARTSDKTEAQGPQRTMHGCQQVEKKAVYKSDNRGVAILTSVILSMWEASAS